MKRESQCKWRPLFCLNKYWLHSFCHFQGVVPFRSTAHGPTKGMVLDILNSLALHLRSFESSASLLSRCLELATGGLGKASWYQAIGCIPAWSMVSMHILCTSTDLRETSKNRGNKKGIPLHLECGAGDTTITRCDPLESTNLKSWSCRKLELYLHTTEWSDQNQIEDRGEDCPKMLARSWASHGNASSLRLLQEGILFQDCCCCSFLQLITSWLMSNLSQSQMLRKGTIHNMFLVLLLVRQI